MFTIVCLGRLDFLVAVLNGLAMLTAENGPAGYGGMVALGLLIGVILTLARAIVTQRLELQWVLAGWLLFYGLFVPKTTVVVEDIYSGATTTVANVPLGPAVIGSITSTVGVTLADAFGTVFASPSMTRAGYMDSLELINAMRDMDYGSANDGDATRAVSGVDLQRSLRAYLVDCVIYDLTMDLPTHSVTWAQLRESRNLLAAIEVQSNTWFTTLYLREGDLNGETLTCTEAYQELARFMRGPFAVAWNQYIGSVLGVTDAVSSMQDALNALFGVGRDAQTYMLNALLKREIELADVGYHAQSNNTAGVVMRVQAMEQRRTQWAAEQSLWAEMARPAIAFVEGFFYAVSPFVAFMVTLGAFGMMLFARYLLLAVWIQLWMPILAVCNLYITIAASADLQHLTAGGSDPFTMVGLDSVWTESASWLAFGGTMVAATPLLSLIVITGSYFALTSFTNKLAGADHIDETIASPNIVQSASVASVGALGSQSAAFSSDPAHGLHRTATEQLVPAISLTSDVRANVQSAHAVRDSAHREWTASFSTALDLSNQRSRERFVSNLHTEGTSGTASQSDAVIEQIMRSAINNEGIYRNLSQEDRDNLQAAIGLALQKGDTVSGAADIHAALANIRSIDDTQRREVANRIEQSVGTRSEHMAQLAEKVQQDASEGITSRFFSAMGVQDATRWVSALRDSRSADESYEKAAALNESAALYQRIDALVIGNEAVRKGYIDDLLHQVASHGLNMTRVEETARTLSTFAQIPYETAHAASAALALAGGTHESRMALAEVLASHGFGTQSPVLESPVQNDALETDALATGSARADVQSHLRETRGIEPEGVAQDVRSGIGSAGSFAQAGEAAVREFFAARKAGNLPQAQEAIEKLQGVITEQRAKHYSSTFNETRGALKAMQDFDLADQVGDAVSLTGSALSEAWQAYSSAYSKTLRETGDPLRAIVSGLRAGSHGWDQGLDAAVEEMREHSRQEGLAAGLPESAARYYAEQSVILNDNLDHSIPRLLGRDPAYEALKEEVRDLMGPEAFVRLDRAATGETVSKSENLQAAVALYRQRQAHVRETDATRSDAEAR